MPTLILDAMPVDVYERIERLAHATNRPLPDQAIRLLRQAIQEVDAVSPRLPDVLDESGEVPASFDLPRPDSGELTAVRTNFGLSRGEAEDVISAVGTTPRE